MMAKKILVALAMCAAMGVGSFAKAELPSVKLMTAPLVDPAAAWVYYGNGATHTTGVIGWTSANRPVEIRELSRSLAQNGAVTGAAYADKVYEYVRDNIEVDYRFGLSKGARGALIDQSGTSFDQAHLMVELLRQGGVAASYRVGTITLTGSQFYSWTGLTDAKSSCQFLADGGIPATVNSASSCASLTGVVTSVTLGHIWVAAASKLYDPSYKQHLFKSGTDLAAALGCGTSAASTCGTTIQGLMPAPTTVSGVQRIGAVPEATINAQLKTYAVNLQNWIQGQNAANKTVLALDDVIGGKLIDQSVPIVADATLPYPSSEQFSWTGDIPDQYRTTLRVQMDNLDQTLYVDELAGKRLRMIGEGYRSLNVNSTYTRNTALYVEYKPLAKSTRPNSTIINADLTLSVDHPYSANGGTYMDEIQSRQTALGSGTYTDGFGENCCDVKTLTIINGWGNASQSTVSHYGALKARDAGSVQAEDVGSPNHLWATFRSSLTGGQDLCVLATPSATPVRDPGCFEQHQQIAGVTWLAESSKLVDMAAQIGGGLVQLHHSLGSILSAAGRPELATSIETAMSITAKGGSTSDRQAVAHEMAAGLSRLEGSVFEQQSDSWEGGSAVSFLRRSASASEKQIPTLWVNAANLATALGQIQNYSASRISIIQNYVAAGYSLLIPQNGQLGSYSFPNANFTIITNAFAGFNTSGDRFAYIIHEREKGSAGGVGSRPDDAAMRSLEVMDYSLRSKKSLSVSLSSGDVSLAPPPDLTTGTGEPSISLQYRRFYNSGDVEGWDRSDVAELMGTAQSAQSVSYLGAGWTHNFDISARMGSDGFKGLGSQSAVEASAAIAGLYTAFRLNTGTLALTQHLAGIFTTNWWIAQLQNNVIIIKRPPENLVFTRLANGTAFAPPSGSPFTLIQTGNREFRGVGFGMPGMAIYRYGNVSLSFTAGDGEVTNFNFVNTDFANTGLPVAVTNPIGVKWNFSRDTAQTYCNGPQLIRCVIAVSNSLGRSISLDRSLIIDENGRQVSFATDLGGQMSTQNQSIFHGTTKFQVTGTDGGITTYEYDENKTTPVERNFRRIIKWFTPSSSTVPLMTVDYDSLYRAEGSIDALNHRTDYHISGLYGSENQKPASTRGPVGNTSSSQIDHDGRTVSTTDPLGRQSRKFYDNAGRLLREVMPEGNGTEYQYDIRGNQTRVCQIAKGRVNWSALNALTEQAPQCNTSLGDLVGTTTYVEGPTIWPCANPKVCNKPSYAIDAKGNRTDYTWSTTHGQILTETSGLNSSGACALSGGVCPVTTYGYTAFTGTDGAIFYLLTSKQEKRDAANSTTTTWSYRGAADKFTLREQVADSGGLALRTCFQFDAVGNLISKTEPRAGLASCP